jgi:hypothetical protein
MSYNNVRSKTARAIAAYLISSGVGTAADTSAANVASDSTYPRTTIHPGIAIPEVPMTGIYRVKTMVSIRGSAIVVNPDIDPRVAFDSRVSAVFDAMMMSDDGATLDYTASAITAAGRALSTSSGNADMADFTCQALYDGGFGDGEPSSDGSSWEEILMFDAVCCGSALS